MWGQTDAAAEARTIESATVAGGAIASIHALLSESNEWPRIRSLFETRTGRSADSLGTLSWSSWVTVGEYVALLDSAADVLGPDAMRELGRVRVLSLEMKGAFYAPVLRSWTRAFSSRPEHLVRVVPHLWRASMRRCGYMMLEDSGIGHTRFRVRSTASVLILSPGFHAHAEGFCEALLGLGPARGEMHVEVPVEETDSLDMSFVWDTISPL